MEANKLGKELAHDQAKREAELRGKPYCVIRRGTGSWQILSARVVEGMIWRGELTKRDIEATYEP